MFLQYSLQVSEFPVPWCVEIDVFGGYLHLFPTFNIFIRVASRIQQCQRNPPSVQCSSSLHPVPHWILSLAPQVKRSIWWFSEKNPLTSSWINTCEALVGGSGKHFENSYFIIYSYLIRRDAVWWFSRYTVWYEQGNHHVQNICVPNGGNQWRTREIPRFRPP